MALLYGRHFHRLQKFKHSKRSVENTLYHVFEIQVQILQNSLHPILIVYHNLNYSQNKTNPGKDNFIFLFSRLKLI